MLQYRVGRNVHWNRQWNLRRADGARNFVYTLTPAGAPNRVETGTPAAGSLPNSLEYGAQAFSTTEEVPFSVGLLTYHNGQTFAGTSATHFPIDITLEFIAPPGLPNQIFNFAFDLELVPNNQIPPDDILTVPSAFSDHTFTHNSVEYTLKLLGFSIDGGLTFQSEFILPEDETVESNLMATITTESPTVIPLPAAAWMGMALMGSIGGVGFIRHRRRQVV